jgi:hypothetical protein
MTKAGSAMTTGSFFADLTPAHADFAQGTRWAAAFLSFETGFTDVCGLRDAWASFGEFCGGTKL